MGTIQDVIDSIAQTAEFFPYSSSDLITYINEYGFDVEELVVKFFTDVILP
jgi:hypothetical protein